MKIRSALKILEENAHNSVLQPNNEVISKLKQLHPQPAEISKDALLQGPIYPINPAHFYDINEQLILKAANATKGSGGPSQMDAPQWKRVLTSNHFKNEAKDLRESLATFAKKIATQILDPSTLESYVATRTTRTLEKKKFKFVQ